MKKIFISLLLLFFMVNVDAESKQENIIINVIGQDTAIVPGSISSKTIKDRIDALPSEFQKSIGKVTFYFEPFKIKICNSAGKCEEIKRDSKACNGFLIKKNQRLYFVTVGHLSHVYTDPYPCKYNSINCICSNFPERDRPIKAQIELPNIKRENIVLEGNKNFFREDSSPEIKKESKETIDISCIDVTDLKIHGDFIPYDWLVNPKEKNDIDNSGNDVFLCGYPGKYMNENFQPDKYQELTCGLMPPRDFGKIIRLSESENPSGFYFDAKLEQGDCGRPVIKKINSKYRILGLFKSSILEDNYPPSFANDSTAIIRLIHWAYEYKSSDNN